MSKTYSSFFMSRRGAIGAIAGAGAAVAAPSVFTTAAQAKAPEALFSVSSAPVARQGARRDAPLARTPQVGERVTLRHEAPNSFADTAVAVYDADGEKLGYVTRQNAPAVRWAMQRGGSVKAQIAQVNARVLANRKSPGWGGLYIDLAIA